MATSGAGSGLPYPERFYLVAACAGFGGSADDSAAVSRFQNDVALLLSQQATVGPCTAPKPTAWNPVEQSKWTSWHGLGSMESTEAMRLFVKILEEEEPDLYSRVPQVEEEPSVDVEMFKPKLDPAAQLTSQNGDSQPEIKTISAENGFPSETEDEDVISICDQWVALPVSGQHPKFCYAHGAAVLHDKMYIFGGNYNGRYLNDLQIPWGGKILSIAGHTKDPSETIRVKEFDPATCLWSNLKTYVKPPISCGGQSVTLIGNTLVIFGGEDAKRSLLNDLNMLDLETMTWDDIDAILVLNMSTLAWSLVTTVEGRVPLASEGLSLVTSAHKGEDFLLSFGGYNGRYSNEVYILKPSHISHSQSRMIDGRFNTDASRDMEPEFEVTQNKEIKEIVVDNVDSQVSISNKATRGHLVEALNAEKEELEAALDKEQLQRQESAVAETKNSELAKELQSVRG